MIIDEQVKAMYKRTRTGFMLNVRAEHVGAQPIYVGYVHDAGSHFEYPIALWHEDLKKYDNPELKKLLPENVRYCLGTIETNEDRQGNEVKLVRVFITGKTKGLTELAIYPEDLKTLKRDGQHYCSAINELQFID
jgi:hypothetical protein